VNKKKKKYPPLEVGQRLWLECFPTFTTRDPFLMEVEVVRVNKSSAYVVYVQDLEKEKESPLERRVDQRTRHVYNPYSAGYGYRVWESQKEYYAAIKRSQEKKELRDEAIKKVQTMTLNELRQFLNKTEEETV